VARRAALRVTGVLTTVILCPAARRGAGGANTPSWPAHRFDRPWHLARRRWSDCRDQEIVAVYCPPDSPGARPDPLKARAQAMGIAVHQPER
jgi:hypothetical protein